ncbi:hypothetical protein U9M48_016071 [Paspalum notatum var. saurae]|uniref:Uncharacterized protein n=1 Tax=Paspalum notatum var. saurae TaxID=547442 RepID=A0AAQ3T5N3_PASNO
MALLLRGCVAPVVNATGLLPPRRRSSRLVAVASAASTTPPVGAGVASHVHAGDEIVGGPNGSVGAHGAPAAKSTAIETIIERVIFDFRFLALLAVAGALAGSVLCFLNGCIFIKEAYEVYWSSCVKGIHSGQMVLKVVSAIDVYLAGTVMLIFGMGLHGLFISNASPDVPSESAHALSGSSLFGMFALKERPKWMKITSLDELKTKVGHVIVMILLLKMFERSKMVTIATGLDLLSYSFCIFLSSASLYILSNLNKGDDEENVMPNL